MEPAGKQFLIGSLVFALAINLSFTMIWSCGGPMVGDALSKNLASTCAEFWLNRYQSMLAGLVALLGAWITVRAMLRQTEISRSDDADRRLSRYAGAVLDVMQKYNEVRPPADGEAMDDPLAIFAALNASTDSPAMREAMIDGAMGMDVSMMAFFVNSCRQAALGTVYERDVPAHEHMIWPLYVALTNGIVERQRRLRQGAKVTDLFGLGTIDRKEVQAAFLDQRPPNF